MGRTKLIHLIAALGVVVVAGCSAPEKEAAPSAGTTGTTAPADSAKLPPGMSYGYKPPK